MMVPLCMVLYSETSMKFTFPEYTPISDSTDDESRHAVLHKELCHCVSLFCTCIPGLPMYYWCNLYVEI